MPASALDRRRAVIESALDTFARRGYRETSMEEVARRARISRPGLYLYFASKPDLLRAAVEHALDRDVVLCEAVLADRETPLRERLQRAFDAWSGQYVGPLASDLEGLLARDADLLGDLPQRYSARFAAALTAALEVALDAGALGGREAVGSVDALRELLLALAVGVKHRAADRQDFADRLDRSLRILFR